MRITFVIPSLTPGGAERVITTMANYWSNRGWNVTLLTFDDGGAPPFYELDPRVVHHSLGIAAASANAIAALLNNFSRLSRLRQAIRASRPEAVISFMDRTNVVTLLATWGMGLPVVVSERNDPAQSKIGRVWSGLRFFTYHLASRLVVQTERAGAFFPPSIRHRSMVIPNPVVRPELGATSLYRLKQPAIVAMGRLVEQKGFDLLIGAFARLKERHPTWSLTIIGEGPLRPSLELLAASHGIQDRVAFPGRIKDPQAVLAQADIFVLSSRFEGFPNALCEAMACGLPVISTDCPSGPCEIIRDTYDGLLVQPNDETALATAMDRLMSDTSFRERLSKRAVEVTQRFGIERVMDSWEHLLATVVRAPAAVQDKISPELP